MSGGYTDTATRSLEVKKFEEEENDVTVEAASETSAAITRFINTSNFKLQPRLNWRHIMEMV